MRKPDSYTVATYEFRGRRRWRRGDGGDVGVGSSRRRFVLLDSDWVIVFGEAWK